MSTVAKITPQISGIQAPSFLADKPIWLMWRFEHHDGEAKPRKVPYYVNGSKRYGVQGRLEDRQQLVTFGAARSAAAKGGFSGIGHACLDGDFTVIDFDQCAPGGKLNPAIEAMAANTYAEYSPSGEGIHLYVKGNIHGTNAKSIATKDQFGVELFSTKGFTTFSGNTLEVTEMLGLSDTVAEASPQLKDLVSLRFGNTHTETALSDKNPLGVSESVLQEALAVLDPDMGYAEWLRVGMALHHETAGQGLALWDKWSAKGSKYPGDGMLQGRWDSFGKSQSNAVTVRSLIQLANQNGAHITLNAVSLEAFDNLEANHVASTETVTRFQRTPAHEFAVVTHWKYIIKNIIPAASIGVLFGESGSGKSFITLDLCIAIARGLPWRGHRTTQSRVVYIVAEGAAGFRNRLTAYAKHHKIDLSTLPLDIISDAPNLLEINETKGVIASIKTAPDLPSLVVIDTLAQTMAGGNENASEDMGKVLAQCKGIHKSTGAMVLLIHHAGKDSSKGARGWSGLRAAADVELEVSRTVQGRVLRSTKQKDGADFQEWGFDLEVVPIGEDQDGDVITSCVCLEAAVPVKVIQDDKRAVNQTAILNAISELALIQTSGIEIKAIVDIAMRKFTDLAPVAMQYKRENLEKAIKTLSKKQGGFVLEKDKTLTIL